MGDVSIRWAMTEDAHGVAVVHVDSWRAAYRGLIDQAVLDALDVEDRTARWAGWIANSLSAQTSPGAERHRMLVAERDGAVQGWATFGAGRDDDAAGRGEIAGLYAHPDSWSDGVGHALILRVEQELRAAGFASAYLWALHGNERAMRFYERHGWHADGGEKVGTAGGATNLHELRHVRELGTR